jgi:predicted amidohydrolase
MMKVIKNMIKAPTNSSTILKECIEQVAISVITV